MLVTCKHPYSKYSNTTVISQHGINKADNVGPPTVNPQLCTICQQATNDQHVISQVKEPVRIF